MFIVYLEKAEAWFVQKFLPIWFFKKPSFLFQIVCNIFKYWLKDEQYYEKNLRSFRCYFWLLLYIYPMYVCFVANLQYKELYFILETYGKKLASVSCQPGVCFYCFSCILDNMFHTFLRMSITHMSSTM